MYYLMIDKVRDGFSLHDDAGHKCSYIGYTRDQALRAFRSDFMLIGKKLTVIDLYERGIPAPSKRRKFRYEWFHDIGTDFFRYEFVKDSQGRTGVRYFVENLTQAQRDVLAGFGNVILSKATSRYAPEIQYDTVILLDKLIPVEREAVVR